MSRNRRIRRMTSASSAGLMFSRLERRQLLAGDVTSSLEDSVANVNVSETSITSEVHVSCEAANAEALDGQGANDSDVRTDCVSFILGTAFYTETNAYFDGGVVNFNSSGNSDLNERPAESVDSSQSPTNSELEPVTLTPPLASPASASKKVQRTAATVEVQREVYFSTADAGKRTTVESNARLTAFTSGLLESRQVFAIAELELATPESQLQDFQDSGNVEETLSQSFRQLNSRSSSTPWLFLESSVGQRERSNLSLGDDFQASRVPTASSDSFDQSAGDMDVEVDLFFRDFESADLLLLDTGLASTEGKSDEELGRENALDSAVGSGIVFVQGQRVKAPKVTKEAPLVESLLLVAMVGAAPASGRSAEIRTRRVAVCGICRIRWQNWLRLLR